METNRFQALSPYELNHLATHLHIHGQYERLGHLITDEDYVEIKTKQCGILGLLEDIDLGINSPLDVGFSNSVSLIRGAIAKDLPFISEYPDTLFQSLWNSLWWTDNPEEADHFSRASKDSPTATGFSSLKLPQWLENWRMKKEADENFLWVRAHRPPFEEVGASNSIQLLEHEGYVVQGRVSPDGRFFVTASLKINSSDIPARIVLFDSSTCLRIVSIQFEVMDLVYSPNGQLIIGCTMDGELHIWDASNLVSLLHFKYDERGFRTVAYYQNDQVLVGCYDGDILQLDALSGKILMTYHLHEKAACSIDVSGDLFVSASADMRIVKWEIGHNTPRLVIKNDYPVKQILISPAKDRIFGIQTEESKLEVSENVKKVRIWDVYTAVEQIPIDLGDTVACINFSLDGKYLVTGHGTEMLEAEAAINLWDLNTLKLIGRFEGHSHAVSSLNFFPGNQRLLSTCWDRTIRVWHIRAQNDNNYRLKNHEDAVFGITFSQDGKKIMTSAWDDRRILIWDTSKGTIFRELVGHESLIRSFRFSEDGRYILSGSGSKYRGRDCSARLWELGSGKEVVRYYDDSLQGMHGHVDPIKMVRFSKDMTRVYTGHANMLSFAQSVELVAVWDCFSGRLINSYRSSGNEVFEETITKVELLKSQVIREGLSADQKNHRLYGPISNANTLQHGRPPIPLH